MNFEIYTCELIAGKKYFFSSNEEKRNHFFAERISDSVYQIKNGRLEQKVQSLEPKEDFKMQKRSKRYQESVKLIDKETNYDAKAALETIEKMPKAKFDETVEAHFKLGVDSKHADQQVRGVIVLPHGTGKTQRVLVFARGPKADEATAAGADFVGAEDLIPRIEKENWFDYDVIVATPDMMGIIGRLGKVLGPKGLMPNPKSGTVTMEVGKAVQEIKAGKIEYRLDKNNIIHCPIGKLSFGAKKLTENYEALYEAIVKAKPAAAKGTYIQSISVSTTMGPGIDIKG